MSEVSSATDELEVGGSKERWGEVSEVITFDEADVIREESLQLMIDGRLTECLSIILKTAPETEAIEVGSMVKFKGSDYLVYQKENPKNINSPIIYFTLLGIGSENDTGKKARKK
jgi:hypothetical protein